MTLANRYINNLSTGYISIDIRIGGNTHKVIRERLAPFGFARSSFDFGGVCTENDLAAEPSIQKLLAPSTGLPLISFSLTPGTSDVPGTSLAAVNAAGLSNELEVVREFVALAGATDLTVYASLPFACKIIDIELMVSTASAAAATAQLRTLAAGAGSVLSDPFDTTTTGRKRDTGAGVVGAVPSLAKGSAIFMRRTGGAGPSDSIGTLMVKLQRLS